MNENFTGPTDAMIGRWAYTDPIDYGLEDTYLIGMDWLSGCASVEDWGCGGGGAKRFCKVPYVGIDGSAGPCTDKIVDLRYFQSAAPGLFMRHVLEHNRDWKAVLTNALTSFTKRMSLIMFLGWEKETHLVTTYSSGIVLIAFKESDIIDPIKPYLVSRASVGEETVLMLEKA